MSKSRRSSIASAACRIDWRPSRWAAAVLWALALLAPLCVLHSDAPRALAWPVAGLALAGGVRTARRYQAQPARRLLVPAGRGEASCDGIAVRALRVGWRGPLAFLHWRDAGGCRHLAFWPDTLPAGTRRELRIALMQREAAAEAASMAG